MVLSHSRCVSARHRCPRLAREICHSFRRAPPQEYKKIILAGCATRDGGRVSVRKVSAVASAISSPRTAGASVNSTTSTRGPDGDTIYL